MSTHELYFRFDFDVARDVLRLTRTQLAMPSGVEDIRRVYAEMARALAPYAGKKALLDLRFSPPGRNDDDFEAAASDATKAMSTHFVRVAVLVRSAAGRLQVRRISHGARQVFQDEAEALGYLHAP